MLELLLCICIVCTLGLFTRFQTSFDQSEFYAFYSSYLHTKSKAMLESEPYIFDFLEEDIRFNEAGNVNMANTIEFESTNSYYTIQLGSGALIVKQ